MLLILIDVTNITVCVWLWCILASWWDKIRSRPHCGGEFSKRRLHSENASNESCPHYDWGYVYTDAVSNQNGFMTWKPHRKRHVFKEFTRDLSNRLCQGDLVLRPLRFVNWIWIWPNTSSPRPNPESSFGFSLRYSAGAYRRKSQHFKTSLPVIAVCLSVYRE